MPVSKRSRPVALTKATKKTRDHKAAVMNDVRRAIDEYGDLVYLFSYDNMRSTKLKDIRRHFRDETAAPADDKDEAMKDDDKEQSDDMESQRSTTTSRIFLGKNKLLQLALGRTPAEEHAENLHLLSRGMSGNVGLLVTNRLSAQVERYFSQEAISEDYACAGTTAPRTVTMTTDDLSRHPTSMMELWRKLGVPAEIHDGVIRLRPGKDPHVVCREGATLTAEQCKVLHLLKIPLGEFRVSLQMRWNKHDKSLEPFV